MKTRQIFRVVHSQVVQTPSDGACKRTDVDPDAERVGEENRMRPALRSLAGVRERFAGFESGFMPGGRGDHEQSDREAL
ncbi:AbrB family transcriptional regulator [Massilia sp. CCM 8734]|nr:AbrB family transcriptional regulator [Massilia sp. CCM 8734]